MNDVEELAKLGFKFGKNGAHSARSMMIEELKELLFARDESAAKQDYEGDIVHFNILHKPTEKSRKLTFRHLVDLYSLSVDIPLFSIFRKWWELSEESQPVLALQLAVARDPILRNSAKVILPLQEGEHFQYFFSESFGDNPPYCQRLWIYRVCSRFGCEARQNLLISI